MNIQCAICKNDLKNQVSKWSYFCDACNYWRADLTPKISDNQDHIFDEERGDRDVISFLNPIRIINFNQILDYVEDNIGGKLCILDVGCASGLFMQLASERGNIVYGVEPNPVMQSAAIIKNLNVVKGYFPGDINKNIQYDAIIFNDVLEHIPDINFILEACYKCLPENGALIINIPNSDGLLFRIAKLMANFHFYGPWNRLWQTMFYTPHLHYFNPSSLALLAKKHNFKITLKKYELESFELKGLWKRISVDISNSIFKNLIIYTGTLLIYPLVKIMPRDSFFAVFTK